MSRNFLRRMSDGNPQAYAITGGSAQFNGNNSLSSVDAVYKWDGHSDFSICLWWYSGALPTNTQNAWIFGQTTDPLTHSGYGLRANGGTGFLNFEVAENPASGQSVARCVPVLGLTANRWYCVLCQFGGSINFMSLDVVDGVSGSDVSGGSSWVNGPASSSAANLLIGVGPSGTDSSGLTCINTAGRVDNLGFWSRLFTAGEVATLKNVSGGKPLGVDWSQIAATRLSDAKAFYNLDAIAGKLVDVRDNTGNGRNLINHPDGNGVLVAVGPERLH